MENTSTQNTITAEKRKKIEAAIQECQSYISKEINRREDTRPADVKERLAWYIAHKAKLEGMLN